MGTTVKGTTIVQFVGTAERLQRQTSQPLERARLSPQPTVEELTRAFHWLQDRLHEATLGARSLPMGGPMTYFRDVSFTSGTAKTLSHRLQVPCRVWLGQPSALSAGSPYVTWTSDARIATLTPQGTFTADVLCLVLP